MRCAPFGPTPGRSPSSSIRSWTTPSYTSALVLVVLFVVLFVVVVHIVVRVRRRSGQAREAGDAGDAGQSGSAAKVAKAAGERTHHLGLHFAKGTVSVAAGREHQIGDRLSRLLGVASIERLLGDPQVDQLALTVERNGDQPAARGSLDLGLGQLLLRVHQLALHLGRSGEDLLHVKLPAWFHALLTYLPADGAG